MSHSNQLARRRLLVGAGAATVAAVALQRTAEAAPGDAQAWDHEADVVCVGSGAAACTAAIVAAGAGAKVIVVEKLPLIGGTTGKSGGVLWIPNNFLLKQKGIVDRKDDCLRYMARYAYPERYDAISPTLGLAEADYRLLEAYYDHASPAVDRLRALGAVKFNEFRLYKMNRAAPDYGDGLAENKVPTGRALEPAGAEMGAGRLLIDTMEAWLQAKQVLMLTETRVTRLIKDGNRVVGVEAIGKDHKTLRLRARRGVVFGSGGFAHNTELVGLHQPSIYGSCAMPGATGDFIPIAAEAGAAMGSLNTAWRAQVVLDEALENRAVGSVVFGVPGDSMLIVNKYGHRVVNEKLNYNDRARAHFAFDTRREEYPNHLLFMLFDQRSADAFAGDFPLPENSRVSSPHVIQGDTLDALFAKVSDKLASIASKTGGVMLTPEFAAEAGRTIARFNQDSRSGNDREFGRGAREYDRAWHAFFSPQRAASKFPPNKFPNSTMHPLADNGPYFCIILGAGALDTNGGPRINTSAQVLDAQGAPIPGLYGAGNCVASPSRGAYFAAGGTIGAAVTFGYLAATHALTGNTRV